jgi:hypothetical protein
MPASIGSSLCVASRCLYIVPPATILLTQDLFDVVTLACVFIQGIRQRYRGKRIRDCRGPVQARTFKYNRFNVLGSTSQSIYPSVMYSSSV